MAGSEVRRIKYPFIVEQVDEGNGTVSWEADVFDLPGCVAAADSLGELLELVADVQEDWLSAATARGMEVPAPSITSEYSGKMTLRMPPSMHRRMVVAAKRNDLSLNAHIVNTLAFGMGQEAVQKTSTHITIYNGNEAFSDSGAPPMAQRLNTNFMTRLNPRVLGVTK